MSCIVKICCVCPVPYGLHIGPVVTDMKVCDAVCPKEAHCRQVQCLWQCLLPWLELSCY